MILVSVHPITISVDGSGINHAYKTSMVGIGAPTYPNLLTPLATRLGTVPAKIFFTQNRTRLICQQVSRFYQLNRRGNRPGLDLMFLLFLPNFRTQHV